MEDQDQQGALGAAMGYEGLDELMPDPSAAAETPIEYARGEYETAKGQREKAFSSVLSEITAAKQRLLAQPTELTRAQYVQGLAKKLATPPERTDPRFYERRNLYTFLRDVGQYGSDVEEAQKAAKLKQAEETGKLSQLMAKYQLEDAQKREAATMELLGKARAAAAPKALPAAVIEEQHYRSVINDPNASADEKTYARAFLANKVRPPASTIQKPDQQAHDYEVVSNPSQYKPSEVLAAQARIDKFTKQGNWTPAYIAKENLAKDKNAKNYLSEMKDQLTFVLPDIDSAIKQIDEGGILATGNLSKWLIGKPWIGQKATDLEKTLEAVRARVGFEKLKKLKDMSPTASSGLGAVSNAEQTLLQSVRGSLARDQSSDNLRANLVRIKKFYEEEVPAKLRAAGIEDIDTALYAIENPEAPSGSPQGSGGPSGGAAGISRDAIQAELARRRKK